MAASDLKIRSDGEARTTGGAQRYAVRRRLEIGGKNKIRKDTRVDGYCERARQQQTTQTSTKETSPLLPQNPAASIRRSRKNESVWRVVSAQRECLSGLLGSKSLRV